ncbi:MAG: hypothetical protein FJY66_03365 [Calditrichaeota bacterium]|nr:hypothetical protein [Calditrichota bacterium]
MDGAPKSVPVGSWEQLTQGRDIAVLAVGSMVEIALEAAEELTEDGISISVVSCRFVKPVDEPMLRRIQSSHKFFVTMEENTGIGGFASVIARALAGFPNAPRLLSLHLPDRFIEHGTRRKLLDQVGLSKETLKGIVSELAGGRIPVAPDPMETGYAFVTMENGEIRAVRATA